MRVLSPAVEVAQSILGEQELRQEEYRPLTYLVSDDVPDGRLIYNVMTKEVLFLESNEDARDYLIRHWFMVPVSNNDKKLCRELREVVDLLSPDEGITTYTILTTTECNARCFYCYEIGRIREIMSEETAHDVAKFVRSADKTTRVHLHWFGGEPLMNMPVIDIICEDLSDFDYDSSIISNGYLFDDSVVEKAVSLWHLKRVQITLDGTEDVYNKTKAFVYRDGRSPFRRVVENIGRLIKADVHVSVRLNLSDRNFDDLMELTEVLVGRFRGSDHLHIYTAVLFQLADHEELYQKRAEIQAKLFENGFNKLLMSKKSKSIRVNGCMVDSHKSIVVSPMGLLGKCEHFGGHDTCGTIYDGITDPGFVNKCRQTMEDLPECDTCPLYPNCIRPAACPTLGNYCVQKLREERIGEMYAAMAALYGEACQGAL